MIVAILGCLCSVIILWSLVVIGGGRTGKDEFLADKLDEAVSALDDPSCVLCTDRSTGKSRYLSSTESASLQEFLRSGVRNDKLPKESFTGRHVRGAFDVVFCIVSKSGGEKTVSLTRPRYFWIDLWRYQTSVEQFQSLMRTLSMDE